MGFSHHGSGGIQIAYLGLTDQIEDRHQPSLIRDDKTFLVRTVL
jgi:hypothetical protein